MHIIVHTTDHKYLGQEVSDQEIYVQKTIRFKDGFIFNIEKIKTIENEIILSNTNYVIILRS